jgi:hypothetical protein
MSERISKEPGMLRGLLAHVAVVGTQGVEITDLWETRRDFEAFGARMEQIQRELNVEAAPGGGSEPEVQEVHHHVTAAPGGSVG